MWNFKRGFTYIRFHSAVKGHDVTVTCIIFPNTRCKHVVFWDLFLVCCLRFDRADFVIRIFTVHSILISVKKNHRVKNFERYIVCFFKPVSQIKSTDSISD
jgi:hypothetical protein